MLRLTGADLGTVAGTALYGLTIVAAAFLLSWAAEAAEVDISQGLAIVFIALVAVLPEYAVDVTFAWKAGQDPAFAPFAVANLTGANRLLSGLGWPLVFFIFWWRQRRGSLRLEPGAAVAVIALTAASVYSFTIAGIGEIALYHSVVMAAIFGVYLWVVSRSPGKEPELVGPARSIGSLPAFQRRAAVGALLVYAAAAILAVAEPFAEGLVHSGTQLGIDEFLLVQWLAPLASEAPEFLIAAILAFRGRAAAGLGLLLSSQVNQWTLLVSSIAIAYAISSETLSGLPLDGRQTEEVLLTAAQILFASAVLLSLSLGRKETLALLLPFLAQFAFPSTEVRLGIALMYLVLAVIVAVVQRRHVRPLFAAAWAAARRGGHAEGAASTASAE
ncbi:MAG: sodium:calcium antiporter [Dehalococcoidia bacterium]|nr:sodium:calcium antiporter [Dehalococcoidia bacterium]